MKRPLAAASLMFLVAAGAAHAAVRAWLDHAHVGVDGTVRLTLQRDGASSAQPDLAPLKRDFAVLSVGSSSSVQIVNGRMSSQTEAQIELSPKRAGTLTVPPIQWGGETSPALVLQVGGSGGSAGGAGAGAGAAASGSPGASAAAGRAVFIATTVDTHDPYVQAGVSVTVRVFSAEPLYRGTLDFPTDDDVLMQRLAGDEQSSAIRNGQSYDVVTRHYVFFPQRSGTLSILGPILKGEVAVRLGGTPFANDPFASFFGSMLTGTKPIRVQGKPIVLDVRPRPAASGSGPWLPARNVRISANWQPSSLRVEAGNPITLDLRMEAVGLAAAQLPNVASMLALPPGVKAYPDQATLHDEAHGTLLVGRRDQSLALIADRAGTYVVPALHLSWWNTATDQAQSVDLPPQTIDVLPAAAGESAGAGAPPPQARPAAPVNGAAASANASSAARAVAPVRGDRRWILVSAGLGLLWIATMLGWWISRRRPAAMAPRREPVLPPAAPPPRAARARAQFHDACRRQDAPAARRALLAWAGAAWPDDRLAGLHALAKRIADPETGAALGELERACYAGGAWDGAKLAARLRELPKTAAPAAAKDSPIAPLYR